MARPAAAKVNNTLENATMVAALGGGNTSPAMEKMAELLTRKLAKEEAEETEQRRIAMAAREAGAKAMQDKRDAELHFQEACPHKKPFGGPAIGGQRDHQGDYQFICLFCSKMWKNDELPPDLKIPMDRVGGPAN